MKCKHADNWTITEFGTAHTSHDFENGKIGHNSSVDDLTGSCFFQCHECGYQKDFNIFSERLPIYLKNRIKTAIEEE